MMTGSLTLYTRYYFVEGHSLNDRPRLASVVADVLDHLVETRSPTADELLSFLNSDEGQPEIMEALKTLDKFGIHSIPKFIVEGKTLIDGAARSDVFIEVFRSIEAKGEIHAGPVFGEILGVPDEIVDRGSHLPQMTA